MKPLQFLSLLILLLPPAGAKTPDADLYVNNHLYRGTYGNFGSRSSFDGLELASPPATDTKLCDNSTSPEKASAGSILLVPRGDCSFEYKLQRALSMGATGVVIYNTLESRYDWNDTDVIYPTSRADYDCDFGEALLENPPFELDPPAYNGSELDMYLEEASPENLCLVPECPSGRCLIASKIEDSKLRACCAWDIHIGMSSDANLEEKDTHDGVAVFITMEQSDELLLLTGSPVFVEARYYPRLNLSSVFIWLLAVFITGFASWNSASEYRRARYKLTHPQESPQQDVEMTMPSVVAIPHAPQEEVMTRQQEPEETMAPPTTAAPTEEVTIESRIQQEQEPTSQEAQMSEVPLATEPSVPQQPASTEPSVPQQPEQRPQQAMMAQRRPRSTAGPTTNVDSMELTMWHAASFVVVASILLLLLFFFEFYTAVTVLYGVGCSGAMAQLIFRPLFAKVIHKLGYSNHFESALCAKVVVCGLGDLTGLDILAGLAGYSIGAAWLYVWFTSNDPSQNPFYWITQNVMGACICILFLSILRLNSTKVATVLLVAVFIYDIFFVFITPYLFGGDSVMVVVATSGGPADVSADFCEKYPSNSDCKQGQPLPMLLAIPKINDFRGGFNLLGLGDIVLPGLLISFAARLDEAKRLVGGHTSLDIRMPPSGGYLLYLIIAYAVGLLFANIAVVFMERGQPALLYLVPTTLGTFLVLGRHELKDLWKGPKVLQWADRLVRYCDSHTFVVTGDAATVAESIEDLELDEEIVDNDEESPRVGIVTLDGSTRELT